MAWLRFGLPLEEEWEVEKQVRAIRECDDLDTLRSIAEQAFRAWCQQSDVVAQLIGQIAEAEVLLAQAGFCEEPDPEYVRWARELYPDQSE